MTQEPKIKIEDLPKDDELAEDELEGVAGGMINKGIVAAKKGIRAQRASDPDSGEEVA